MSRLCLELILIFGLCLHLDTRLVLGTGTGTGSVSGLGLGLGINHEVSSLLNHRQILIAEMARLYMEPMLPETQMLLDDLQQRDHQLQMQIELIESGNVGGGVDGTEGLRLGAENFAINLTADFENLQKKLDELKLQLESTEHFKDRDDGTASTTTTTSTPSTNSYFWTSPLLAMPDFPPSGQQNNPPSLIKRLMAILRPNSPTTSSGSSNWRNFWSHDKQDTPLSAEDLLGQLKKQRDFLDQTIKRMELLANKKS